MTKFTLVFEDNIVREMDWPSIPRKGETIALGGGLPMNVWRVAHHIDTDEIYVRVDAENMSREMLLTRPGWKIAEPR